MLHPQVAFRDCEHCKKFVYDETTGEPRVIQGNPVPRVAATRPPCDTKKGCLKGHWSDPIQVKEHHMPMLTFYEAVQSTHGACLSESQRREPIVIKVLNSIDAVMRHAETVRMSTAIRSSVIAASAMKGSL